MTNRAARFDRPARWCALAVLAAAAGCSSQLETGYKPRPLTATPAQRRAFYASPFTPEAAAAEADKGSGGGGQFRKPGAY